MFRVHIHECISNCSPNFVAKCLNAAGFRNIQHKPVMQHAKQQCHSNSRFTISYSTAHGTYSPNQLGTAKPCTVGNENSGGVELDIIRDLLLLCSLLALDLGSTGNSLNGSWQSVWYSTLHAVITPQHSISVCKSFYAGYHEMVYEFRTPVELRSCTESVVKYCTF